MTEPAHASFGHNSRGSLTGAADANIETGVLLLCKEFLVTAISDRRLDRTHLRVLACIVNFVNRKTAKAWPDRKTIADVLGVAPVTVSNKLRELRLWGYLIAERERVEEANNRSLLVYTFGNVDHETIRSEIEAYVARIKNMTESKVTEDGDSQDQKSPPGVTQESPGTVTVTEGGDYQDPKVTEYGARKSPSTVDSNLEKELLSFNIPKQGVPLQKRPSRLPDNWVLPEVWSAWALEHFAATTQQVVIEGDKFRDYFHAKSGKDAAKLDWQACWRTWWNNGYHRIPRKLPAGEGSGARVTDDMRKLHALVGPSR